MERYLTKGTVVGVLSFAAVVAGFFGKDALSAFLNDPNTAQNILVVTGAVGSLVAGVLEGLRKK